MSLPFDPPQMAQRLLRWYGAKGRDLPWRQNRDPYCIWLSEIMLQQTGVVTVIPYYQRFLDKFPTLQQLAAAPLDDVIQLWAGLGYYSRARNLHKAAQQVMAEHSGVFPSQLDDIQALPGIGRSTAGAILSIAFDQPAPILDGNVRRVLVRLFAWRNDPRSSAAEKQLWQWAEQLTPPQQAHDYAQAIMDLGATVCTPRTPDCANCPLRALCVAHQQGLAETLPIKRKRAKAP
ncbi:MAG: A/G-specific adenine glycosylase, partial [Desulfuromonadales bacterium]|nr:A/G-specific adenine glycosylase [Desulfuromonadales bacterium]